MRKETSVLAFEGEIPESWAIPLLAEWHCSTRQIAFRNRRTERICWSIMYLPFVLAELRTSSSFFVQEKRTLEIMWCWKWPEMVFHRLPLYHRIKPCQDPAVRTETPLSLLWNSKLGPGTTLFWITILPNTSQAHTGRLEVTAREETARRHLVLEAERDFIAQICYETSWYANLPSSAWERLCLICCYMYMQF